MIGTFVNSPSAFAAALLAHGLIKEPKCRGRDIELTIRTNSFTEPPFYLTKPEKAHANLFLTNRL